MEKLETIVEWLKERVNQQEFKDFLVESLIGLCRINTIPSKDLRQTAENESLTFRIIRDLVDTFGLPGVIEDHPISPSIRHHPSYTLPYYAHRQEAYDGRYNLVYLWESSQKSDLGRKIGVNAHIDTVAPYIGVTRKADTLFGRGTCDDKGGCILMIATLYLLKEIEERFGVVPGDDLTFMFVIDEETGGNGSLSLALDERLRKHYDILVVVECCDQQIHPGNRGAVWYKIEIPRKKTLQPIILAMEIVQELEKEGTTIKDESDHPLFPQRPVQTCHGVLGPFGEHPSRICGNVEFALKTPKSYAWLSRLADKGVQSYIQIYGDKTKAVDPETGKGVVEKHYEIEQQRAQFLLKVWGRAGHMGSIHENDNAITKASFIIREIAREDSNVDARFADGKIPDPLVMEGGQGFVPTHTIDGIKTRLNEAMLRAYKTYALQWGMSDHKPFMTFEKLHNNAFNGDPNSPSMKDAVQCAELVGISIRKPILGFTASCDARLFAGMYPRMEVITTGPGRLKDAHSDEEKINISELGQSCAMLALFLLVHTRAKNIENFAC